MTLSFLIVNYNSSKHLRVCLKSIYNCHFPYPFEVLVVDNASQDDSVMMIQKMYPQVRLIRNQKNIGYSAANNLAMLRAKGSFFGLINPDIIFHKSSDFAKILDYLTKYPNVAILGPKLLNPDLTIQLSCFRKYNLLTPLFRRTFLGKLKVGCEAINHHLMTDFDHNQTRDVDWLLGACFFVPSWIIQKVGLMHEEFFLYFGDYEWCDRAQKKGYAVRYFSETSGIFHYHRRESAAVGKGLKQIFSYPTRVHIKDWLKYLKIKKDE